jgi:hypothetical protein
MIHTSVKEPTHQVDSDVEGMSPMLSYQEELEEQLENTVRTIYFYEQSYLVDWVRSGVIQQTIDLDAITTVSNYCIHFDYKL